MTDEPVDFAALAAEAAKTAYDPRAKRCWPWSHQWTMWETERTGRQQTRRCTGCGKTAVSQLRRTCDHEWRTLNAVSLFSRTDYGGKEDLPFARALDQQCTKCGDIRRVRTDGR
jgi:hypothetical protein